ncbi:MAG: HNH endonuclease [Litorimonas sp.]
MAKVIDPETNQEVTLWPTDALTGDIQKHSNSFCTHEKTSFVMRTVSDGSKQYVEQCLKCGLQRGSARSQKDIIVEPEPWDESLAPSYDRAKKKQLDEIFAKHLTIQKRKTGRFSEKYVKHLSSEKWLKTRVKIFRRANNLCEGCLENPARDIHHLTYENLGDEFMFELIALCRPCHERVERSKKESSEEELDSHSVSDETASTIADVPELTEGDYEGDWLPCHACSFQSGDEYSNVICSVFNIPSEIALADEKLCGPNEISFRPLG